MAYDEKLAARIRAELEHVKNVEEKQMMGGIVFMLNGKMCIGIIKDELMCRINPNLYEEALGIHGCREMDFTGKPMKGWVLISEEGMRSKNDFEYWINLALQFNKHAKAHKKRKKE